MTLSVAYDESGRIHATSWSKFSNVEVLAPEGLRIGYLSLSKIEGAPESPDSMFLSKVHHDFKIIDRGDGPSLTRDSGDSVYLLAPKQQTVVENSNLASLIFTGNISVTEVAYGSIGSGLTVPHAVVTNFEANFDAHANRVVTWDVVPDPIVYTGGTFPITYYGRHEMDIERIWSITESISGSPDLYRHVRLASVFNPNINIMAYHLILCTITV